MSHQNRDFRGLRRAFFPVALAAALLAPLALSSCGDPKGSVAVGREQLFTLGYGPAEDQIDLFQLENAAGPLKTRLAMREGIFYVSNGNGAKVVRYSSFGDVLSMLYDPERNPEPLLLKPSKGEEGPGRRAYPYPFLAVGEVAVDSRQTVYVEDRLPPERRVFDKDSGSMLDYVALRFDKEGRFLDYLGQEGVGGTPFPFIAGIYVTPADDCVVVSMTQASWLVHWFDARGFVRYSLKIRRDSLPQPSRDSGLIASLDRVLPDSDGKSLLLKVDYYREAVDPQTKSRSGIEYAGSWAFRMDPSNAAVTDRWEIPYEEKVVKQANDGGTTRHVRIPELLGVSGDRLFLTTADDEGKSYLSIFDLSSRNISRYSIDIAPDELFYSTLCLSSDGIVCALLGTKYEARVVWWRFDKLLGASPKAKLK